MELIISEDEFTVSRLRIRRYPEFHYAHQTGAPARFCDVAGYGVGTATKGGKGNRQRYRMRPLLHLPFLEEVAQGVPQPICYRDGGKY